MTNCEQILSVWSDLGVLFVIEIRFTFNYPLCSLQFIHYQNCIISLSRSLPGRLKGHSVAQNGRKDLIGDVIVFQNKKLPILSNV